MDKKAVGGALEEIASLLELKGENPFRVRAYRTAGRALATFPRDLAGALGTGELAEVRGIGPAMVNIVRELLQTGRSDTLERLRDDVPPGLAEMLQISGLGVATADATYAGIAALGLTAVTGVLISARVALGLAGGAIIVLLGWPLEWTEIIIIFVPIFLPLWPHFHIDPMVFGILVALNLQTSFLTPPMAMSAYYLKGIAPPFVQLWTIFRGCFPFLAMVFVTMFLVYVFPQLMFWLPNLIYGK